MHKLNEFYKKCESLEFLSLSSAVKWLQNNNIILSEEIENFLLKEFNSTKKYIRSLVRRYEKIPTNKTDKLIKTKFTVSDSGYVITCSKGEIYLDVETVDNIFYDFSIHGLDLSTTQIINKYRLKPWEWHAIKNALNIYKHSNIYSDYTLNKIPVGERKNFIENRVKEAVVDKTNIEDIYNSTIIKEYKRVIKEHTQRNTLLQTFKSFLYDIKNTFEYKNIEVAVKKSSQNRPINIFLSDLHAGAEIKELLITPDFDMAILRKKLSKVAEEVNKLEAKEVNLFFLGDLIESFTGHNHKNVWQELEKGMFGANIVKNVITLLLEFISKVNNVKDIYGIGGNHDRGDSNNLIDYRGEIGGIIFHWLDTLLPFNIEFDFNMVNPTIDNIKYICMHGHNKEAKQTAEKVILDYGDQNKYNLLISGHLHTHKVLNDTRNFRQVVCPSVFTGNNYSERLGYTSNSGFMIIQNNGEDKPNMFTYSI